MNEPRECRRCGRAVATTTSHHVRAHRCPHGKACVISYSQRRCGARAARCAKCLAGRQLWLFPEAST